MEIPPNLRKVDIKACSNCGGRSKAWCNLCDIYEISVCSNDVCDSWRPIK